jgi:hypothetical protein
LGFWVLGFGVWGFGFWPNPPIPNPQSPIPNPQSDYLKINLNILTLKNNNYSFILKLIIP